MIIFDIWAWHIIFHTMSEPNYPLLSWAGFEVGTFQISAHIHECHPNSLITANKKRQFNEQNGEGEISKWNFLWWVSKQRVNVVVVHSCWGNYGRGEGAVLLGGTSPEHPPWKYPWTNTAEVQLLCSQASQLLAEIPFIVQPTAWLRGLLSPRNRDAFGEAGPEADASGWERFMPCKANRLWLAVSAGLLECEPKGTLQSWRWQN